MIRALRSATLLVFCLEISACGGDERLPAFEGCGAQSKSSAVTTGVAEPMPVADTECGAVITEELLGDALHVEECSHITYSTNPPSSGRHYPTWAAFTVHERAVARGFWVHSLEHGAVAILHNCKNCDDALSEARAMIEDLSDDPRCFGVAERRVLMTPDPLLDVPWAASAWGFTLRSSCFEAEVFRRFVLDRRGLGPENLCSAGRTF